MKDLREPRSRSQNIPLLRPAGSPLILQVRNPGTGNRPKSRPQHTRPSPLAWQLPLSHTHAGSCTHFFFFASFHFPIVVTEHKRYHVTVFKRTAQVH